MPKLNTPNPKLIDDDNPEWTPDDFAVAVPFTTLPQSLQVKLKGLGRGPNRAATKARVSIRLSPDVVEHFRATGRGWQTRLDGVLRAAVFGK